MKNQYWIAAFISLTSMTGWAGSREAEPEPGIPRVIVLAPQRVLTLTAQGDPNAEAVDIATLKGFLARNGFSIKGYHEEVYLKGPGMLFKGDPRKYRTLIRYQVDRIGEEPAPIAKQSTDR